MSTQLIGFSIGGVARRFLVAPPSMIWPANLVGCALFNTLHSRQYAGIGKRGGVSRERFFIYVSLASFFWCKLQTSISPLIAQLYFIDFFPGYFCERLAQSSIFSPRIHIAIVQGLSYFSWVTWIRPEDPSKFILIIPSCADVVLQQSPHYLGVYFIFLFTY